MINKPLSRQADILVQDLENELLIYDLRIDKAYCLNQTAALVFGLSDGTRTASEISELMSKKLGTAVGEDFVWLALQGLEKENLTENSKELADYFAGFSRREIIKKVGLASMVAFPVIASVVAPSAAAAQSSSLFPLFTRCSSPGQCASGSCAPTSFLPVGRFCCPPGAGGAQPGAIGTAIGLECFNSCTQAATVCCSGAATPTACDSGFCASQQQFCCACL